ncbi:MULTISPECIES: thioredoxin domain-containing protein [Vagococcus]|uniref:Protein-disulfide isomerase n=1 Tax=Vagococcus fluvialis bH819 TaxID=1255619 RepID=A0A1X6WPZ3_9ENTE|nr:MULTISPECIES: thioredoxin domain-containing protein [Vagococcus]SLM86340.1 Protein-disulfide isomerase [Vagococcus fluvialis bH819]HCM88993.1 thioredoxin [Vagococcus sp.]
MGMTDVDVTKINTETGIKIGDDNAPTKIVEFINLRCPYCRQWSDEKDDLLQELVNEGKIQRIIKLFNKEKPALTKGNVMHGFVPNDASAISAIRSIYETQDTWGDLEDHTEIANFAESTLSLTRQNSEEISQAIVKEAEEANVFFIPTVIVGNQVFDQKISNEELLKLLK